MGKEQLSLITKARAGIREWLERPVIQENRRLVLEQTPIILDEIKQVNQKFFKGRRETISWEEKNYCHVDRIMEPMAVTKEGKIVEQLSPKHHGFLAYQCELVIPGKGRLTVILPHYEHRYGIITDGPHEVFIAALTRDERRRKKQVCWPQITTGRRDGKKYLILGRSVSLDNIDRTQLLSHLQEAITKEAKELVRRTS